MSTVIPSLVALGGGHGLSATLRAARTVADRVTAVVTVADDGGSSGRLRREFGLVPPGDLRMALCALAAPTADEAGPDADPEVDPLLVRLFQHRYAGNGALAGHAVGNLVFTGLWELLGDPVAALDALRDLMGVRGRVLPMSPVALDIAAEVVGLESDPRVVRSIVGQVAVATTPGQVRQVRLIPEAPPAADGVVAAIDTADAVVLGPGSWFTSVIPNVLVPEIAAALTRTQAHKVLVLNLAPQPGETAGFSAERYLHVLRRHSVDLRVDTVLVESRLQLSSTEHDHLARAAATLGADLHPAELAHTTDDGRIRPVHDPRLLAAALAAVLPAATDPCDGAPTDNRGVTPCP